MYRSNCCHRHLKYIFRCSKVFILIRKYIYQQPCITITWPLTITITIATIFTNPMIAKAIPITLATILITVTTNLDRVHAWLEINNLVEEPEYYHPNDDSGHLFKPLVELDQLAVQWGRQSLWFWKIKWHLLASRAFLSRTEGEEVRRSLRGVTTTCCLFL